jgi:hypothetical protein
LIASATVRAIGCGAPALPGSVGVKVTGMVQVVPSVFTVEPSTTQPVMAPRL